MTPQPRHIPVLLRETVAALALRPGETALDCTAGLGGHAAELAAAVGPTGTLILNDADAANLAEAERRVRAALSARGQEAPIIVALHGNFADAPRKLAERALAADAALADLGFASAQMEDAERGLSFLRDGPLDMRFDRTAPVSAADLIASLSEPELVEILRDFGEERDARRIAARIVRERTTTPIRTTAHLARIVRETLGPGARAQRIDPATRTFQALRIAVNDELGSLSSLLESVTRTASAAPRAWLAAGARVAIISFHSLEDRLVKQSFGALAARSLASLVPPGARQPLSAAEDEQETNPRARSAKLRAIRLGPPTFAAGVPQRPKV